jgi:hypothetical protein
MLSRLDNYIERILSERNSRPSEAMLADEIIRLRALYEPETEVKAKSKELVNFLVYGCENPACKWFNFERTIDKEWLCVDYRNCSIFILGAPFMCECSYHLRVEPVFRESVPPNPSRAGKYG